MTNCWGKEKKSMSGWQHSFIREINGYVSRRWPSTGESRHTRTHTCVHTHTCAHTHTHARTHTGLGNGYNNSPGHIVYPVSLSFHAYTYISIYLYIHIYRDRERDRQIDFKKQVHIILDICWVQNLQGRPAGWRPRQALILQLRSEVCLLAEFLLPQERLGNFT